MQSRARSSNFSQKAERMKPAEGRKRVIIEEIQPAVDCGRYSARRVLGDQIAITATLFGDGHDHVAARLLYRHETERRWRSASLSQLDNDLWTGSFSAEKLGDYRFTLQAWIDHFSTWCADLKKRLVAQPDPHQPSENVSPQDIPLALRTGALLIEQAAARAREPDSLQLKEIVNSLRWMADQNASCYDYPITAEIMELVGRYPDLSYAAKSDRELRIWVDRPRARFSTWYELFPRSCSPEPGRHGTLADVQAMLPTIAAMGFDVLYLPPIHPIGSAFRKGPNNNVVAQPGDEGSPWAIGSAEGGHKSIHPKLGTLVDFEHLVSAAHDFGMELALDIAFQCSPDHPWVTEHPAWFTRRPDGFIQYAENPPKKYQDIYPLNFESTDWRSLWEELHSVFAFWVRHGVRAFRVDNPHTKALSFWEWVIAEIHKDHPDVLFLAEAFTRPRVMYSLAKAGFSQSYTYFTWRTTKADIQQYFEELTRPPVSNFFRANLWPNTPDILHESLQTGGRLAFQQRLILAATLGANYGIYGPAFELCENTPFKAGSEEYLNSEKYEIRRWNRSAAHSLTPLITRINQIRHENSALQGDTSLHFHQSDNPQILCYSKSTAGHANTILVAVNLDPHNEQAAWLNLDLHRLGLPWDQDFVLEDLLTGDRYKWRNRTNYVALRPEVMSAHIFRIQRKVETQA